MSVVKPTIVAMFKQSKTTVGTVAVFLLVACGSENGAGQLSAGSGGAGIDWTEGAGDGSTGGARAQVGTGHGEAGGAMGSDGDGTTGDGMELGSSSGDAMDSSTTFSGSTGEFDGSTSGGDAGPPSEPTFCGGQLYACGDMLDNDGDGLYDLDDPECTSPCDDDEGSFQTGIPGDNMDCHQDCFFDGNSGQGDDGCNWNLHCDPLGPGDEIGCEYTGGGACAGAAAAPSQACLDYCQPFVPAGCDCFGCCTVALGDGTSVEIFLNSGPDCALDNLGACATCTSQAEVCGNTCDPAGCELCFGQDELPPECEGNVCDGGMPACEGNGDCVNGFFCLQGCCHPEPAG